MEIFFMVHINLLFIVYLLNIKIIVYKLDYLTDGRNTEKYI